MLGHGAGGWTEVRWRLLGYGVTAGLLWLAASGVVTACSSTSRADPPPPAAATVNHTPPYTDEVYTFCDRGNRIYITRSGWDHHLDITVAEARPDCNLDKTVPELPGGK